MNCYRYTNDQQMIKHIFIWGAVVQWVAHSLSFSYVMGSNPSTAFYQIIKHQPSASWDHCVVLTGRFSSLPAVVHSSASYPSGKANRVAAYQWQWCGVNTAEQKELCQYPGSSLPIRFINYKINYLSWMIEVENNCLTPPPPLYDYRLLATWFNSLDL